MRSTRSDAGTPKTLGLNVDGSPAPTAWTNLPARRIRASVTGPTTHVRGKHADVARDRPAAHKSPNLMINETPVPGRMVFRSGSDR
jgi:hypothetical protein